MIGQNRPANGVAPGGFVPGAPKQPLGVATGQPPASSTNPAVIPAGAATPAGSPGFNGVTNAGGFTPVGSPANAGVTNAGGIPAPAGFRSLSPAGATAPASGYNIPSAPPVVSP